MDAQVNQMVQVAAGLLGGVLIALALLVLWIKTPSSWLLLALGGEAGSFLFRLLLAVDGSLFSSFPALMLVWQATGLMVAAGLFGYALERPREERSTPPVSGGTVQ